MLKKLNLGDDQRHVKSGLLSFIMHTSMQMKYDRRHWDTVKIPKLLL